MIRRTCYIRWIIIIVLIILCVFWLSYFFECVYLIRHHLFAENNGAMNFLKRVSDSLGSTFVVSNNLFNDDFYLKDFPAVSFLLEVFFLGLLGLAAFMRKDRRKWYALAILVSILCFIGLYQFLGATLRLFIPG